MRRLFQPVHTDPARREWFKVYQAENLLRGEKYFDSDVPMIAIGIGWGSEKVKIFDRHSRSLSTPNEIPTRLKDIKIYHT